MKSKSLLFTIVLILIAVAAFFEYQRFRPIPVKHAPNFNVILISLDTTRADFIGCYGNRAISTPNIDRLANEGVLFENFYSTINTTLAAHSSIFTGLYPRNHGVGRNSMRLNQRNLTMAEFLRSKNYETAAFIGSYALASVFGINQGFHIYDESFIGDPSQYIAKNMQAKNVDNHSFEWLVTKTNVGHIMRSADEVNHAFLGWLAQNKQKPFFAFVHYYDAHFPYDPPEKWYKKRLDKIPPDTPLTQQAREEMEGQFKTIPPIDGFRPEDIDHLKLPDFASAMLKLYLSEIEYTDSAVGQILDTLHKQGLESNTIVILMADHGENLVDHTQFDSYFRHGFLTHESETHIPFIIACPGVLPQGRRVQALGSEVDVLSTVLDLLGYNAPLKTDGTSLFTELFGDTRKRGRAVFAEASQPHAKFDEAVRQMEWVNDLNSGAVRIDNYKYINVPWKSFDGLFDIPDDPTEIKNLGPKESSVLKHMQNALADWRKSALTGNVDTTFQLSPEERQKLESLGYVQ